jgi:hypothetical protein
MAENTLEEWENEISDNLNELVEGTSKLSLEGNMSTQDDETSLMHTKGDKEPVKEGPTTIEGNFPATQNPAWDKSESIYSVYLLIEDRYCGGLIGRSGKSIAAIRELTGATICLQDRRLKFDNHLPKRALKLYGPESCLKKAIVATAHRLLEVKAANLAYKNNTEISSLPEFPTYEITMLSPSGMVTEEFRSGGHVVIETFMDWELVDIWGIEKLENEERELPFSELCMKIVKESGLGSTPIDETKLSTAHVSRRGGRPPDAFRDYRPPTNFKQSYSDFGPRNRRPHPRNGNNNYNNKTNGMPPNMNHQYGPKNGSMQNMNYNSPSFQMQNQNFPPYKVTSTNYSINPSQTSVQATFAAPFGNMHNETQSGFARQQDEAWPKPNSNTSRDLYQILDTSRSQQYPIYGTQPDGRQQYQQGVTQQLPDQAMGANLYYLPRMNPDWEDI